VAACVAAPTAAVALITGTPPPPTASSLSWASTVSWGSATWVAPATLGPLEGGDLPEDGTLYAGETKLKLQTRYKKWQMKGHVACQGFLEPRNRQLARGVEPLDAVTLLTPTDGDGDGSEPAITAPLSVFFAASSEAFFFVTASSVAFFFAAASFAAAPLIVATVSPTAELLLHPPGTVAHAAADEVGLGTGAARGGPSIVDLPRPCALICLCSGTSSSDDTSSSLRMTHTTFPFHLLGVGLGAAPPWPLVPPALGICTP
jgi:hypothetical protein